MAFKIHATSKNPTVNNIKRWFAGKNDSSTKYLISSDVPSIILFMFSYRLRALNTLYFYFCEFMKKKEKKIETIFAKNSEGNYQKKKLGTSDAWSTSHLS